MGLNKSIFAISFKISILKISNLSNTKDMAVQDRKKDVALTIRWSNEA